MKLLYRALARKKEEGSKKEEANCEEEGEHHTGQDRDDVRAQVPRARRAHAHRHAGRQEPRGHARRHQWTVFRYLRLQFILLLACVDYTHMCLGS